VVSPPKPLPVFANFYYKSKTVFLLGILRSLHTPKQSYTQLPTFARLTRTHERRTIRSVAVLLHFFFLSVSSMKFATLLPTMPTFLACTPDVMTSPQPISSRAARKYVTPRPVSPSLSLFSP
jgi:hypothetical protein